MSRCRIQFAITCIVFAAQARGGLWQTGADTQAIAEGERLRAEDRYQEARGAFLTALREADQRHAPDGFVAAILDDLGVTEMYLGRFSDAERLLQRSLSLSIRASGPNGVAATEVKGHLAELYTEELRLQEAETLLRQVLETLRADPASNPVEIATAMCDLALARAWEHKYREAEILLQKALRQYEERLGPDSPMLATALNPLARVLTAQHRYPEAMTNAERTWKILRASPDTSMASLAATMAYLGELYLLTGRAEEAEYYAKGALTRAEAAYGPESPRVAECLRVYAAVLKRLNRKDEAKAADRRAKAIWSQNARDNPEPHMVNVNALIR